LRESWNQKFVKRVKSETITKIWPWKRIDRTRILKRALKLNLKKRTLWDDPE
jgi:hypothetical protein